MRNWKPVDVIVGILVVTVSGAVLATILARAAGADFVEPVENAKLLIGVVTTMLSVVSMYVGAKIQGHRDEEKNDELTRTDQDA